MPEFKCEECYKSFDRNDRLIVHREKCKSKICKSCSHCTKKFTKLSNLKRHEETCKARHPKITVVPYLCPRNETVYGDKVSLDKNSDDKQNKYYCKRLDKYYDDELDVILTDNNTSSSIVPSFKDSVLNSFILNHASIICASRQEYTTYLEYNFPLPLEIKSPHYEINELLDKLFESRKTTDSFRINFSLGIVFSTLHYSTV